jgi:hypothetical protein
MAKLGEKSHGKWIKLFELRLYKLRIKGKQFLQVHKMQDRN